ncbi:MAG: sigma-70 family RNA polymerase sigma factor [Acidimicrobiia bacterium]|nr:sigma-70 family RNA polymerase sigma factor [Acidimicrobiia bacterium]
MIRRNGDDRGCPPATALDELIGQLEAGSPVAEQRLVDLVRRPISDDQGRTSSRDVLDRIARSAAAGSPYGLELLLALIVQMDLARPAVRRVTSDPTVTEDIGQEVLVAVARSIHRYRADATFTTWLFAVARNVAVSHVRRLPATAELADDDALFERSARTVSSLVTERDAVREAIDSLPARLRQTVVLRDIDGLSYAEIAAREGLEINTVRSRLSRGRALLALKLPS